MDLSPSNAPRRVSVLASLDKGRLLILAAAGLSFLASVALFFTGSREQGILRWPLGPVDPLGRGCCSREPATVSDLNLLTFGGL